MVKLLRANDQNGSTFLQSFLNNIKIGAKIKLFSGTYTEDKYRDFDIDGGTHLVNSPSFAANFLGERNLNSNVLKFYSNMSNRRMDPRGIYDYGTWNYFPDNGLTRMTIPITNAGTITTVGIMTNSKGATFFEVSTYNNPIPGTFIFDKIVVNPGDTVELLDFTIGAVEVR